MWYCHITGNEAYTLDWNGTSWSGTGYFPAFPASCPYVTAVGGTMNLPAHGVEIAMQVGKIT